MAKGNHLLLRAWLSLFCNLHCFNIKAAEAQHPVIQKEQEPLAKGATEPLIDGAGFYSNVFAVSKHSGGLHPIFNLQQFNHYMHISSFRMPTMKQVWQFIQQGSYAFSIDLEGCLLTHSYCQALLLFFAICVAKYAISVEGFAFWAFYCP